MKSWWACAMLAVFVTCVSGARAQVRSPAQPFAPRALAPVKGAPMTAGSLTAKAAKPSSRESLLIGPGDLLQITVLREPELTRQVRVRDSGFVTLPLIGNVHVAGMDPATAGSAIAAKYLSGDFLKYPSVSVFVEQYAGESVSVLGQVAKPGTYAITAPRALLDVLAMAGGLTKIADRHIMIERAPGVKHREERVFLSNRSGAALMANVMIDPGDTILVPKAAIVYVLGDVTRPGGYPMEDESRMTLLQALALAGGVRETANKKKARVIHSIDGQYETQFLRLKRIEDGKAPDQLLAADDVVYVPFSFGKHLVMGATAIVASASSALIYAGY